MTGMGALLGGGLLTIPGSTPFGGQITPLNSESRLPSGGLPVVSPERGVAWPSGAQSGLVDGGFERSFCPYKGEVEIAVRIAARAKIPFIARSFVTQPRLLSIDLFAGANWSMPTGFRSDLLQMVKVLTELLSANRCAATSERRTA
jgi:hypothetical protein